MGFTINYRSTRSVSPAEAAAIRSAAREACRGRTWLSCEPVILSRGADGHLSGACKPNFRPHPEDVAGAAREGLPDGTARDLLDVLCRVSRDHGVDWEISHDHSSGPLGQIRAGECDGEVLLRLEAIADVADYLGSLSDEEFFGPA